MECSRLYFSTFLFRVGLFTLTYMVSWWLLPYCVPPCLWSSRFPQILCGQDCSGAQKWVVVPSNILYTFLQKFQMIPLYIHYHSQSCHTYTNKSRCSSLCLGDTSKFFMVVPSLKCTCAPYFWKMVLKLSQVPLYMWNYNMAFLLGMGWDMPFICCVPLLVLLFSEVFGYIPHRILALQLFDHW